MIVNATRHHGHQLTQQFPWRPAKHLCERRCKQCFVAIILATGALLAAGHAEAQTITNLHDFDFSSTDGYFPLSHGVLTSDGTSLVGTTFRGGTNDEGVIWRVNTDGTGYSVLHNFSTPTVGPSTNTRGPIAIDSADVIYGTTQNGGANGNGVVWSIKSSGADYTVLHDFDDAGSQDGFRPAGLTLSGGTLYGFAFDGGQNSDGTLYSIGTDGTGFNVLHDFGGSAGAAEDPVAPPLAIGNKLFGTAGDGGANGRGAIYSVNDDGSDFTILHSFPANTFFSTPLNGLTAIGSTLYGTYSQGQSGPELDYLYSIETDGSSFTILQNLFALGEFIPDSTLTVGTDGVTLFGTTQEGGVDSSGAIYAYNTADDIFSVVHSFAFAGNDGYLPTASGSALQIALDGSALFGTTQFGDSTEFNFAGNIWRLSDFGQPNPNGNNSAVPEPTSIAIWSLIGFGLAGFGRFAARNNISCE